MEYNNDISSNAFSALRDISASQMNTLLTFDSPPETPQEPSQMLLSSSLRTRQPSFKRRTDQENDNAADCSILRFNNQPFPSQIESEIDFSIFQSHHEDLDDVFSEPWSISTDSFGGQKEKDEKSNAENISKEEMEKLLQDINEFPEILGDQKSSTVKTFTKANDLFFSQNINDESVIITSPDIDHITLEDTEVMEAIDNIETQDKAFIKNDEESLEITKRLDITQQEINDAEKAKINKINDTRDPRMDSSSTDTKRNSVEPSTKSSVTASNKDSMEFSKAANYNSQKSLNLSTVVNNDDDDDMELDIDFDELNALEKSFSSRFNNQRQCQTQLELNPVRPSFVEKLVTSCPPPLLKPITPTPTDSTHPMDFLQLNYSKTTCDSQLETTQERNFVGDLNLTMNFTQQLTPTPKEILEFPATPPDYNDCNESKKSENLNTSRDHTKASLSSTLLRINSSSADATMVPSSIKQLYDVIKAQYSDFSFMYALSAQLCQDRIPMDCFVTLKMGLLLSLASIGPNPDMPPIPIIAIGNDTYMTNYLMTTVGQLASRFVGPTEDTKPPSSNGYRNHNWIEADPILLAHGGVYYVGDWSRLKMLRAERLFKDIESSSVTVDKHANQYPLQAAIWAHWRSFKYNSKDQQMFNKFVKIFGIPIYVADDNHETLLNYTLEQASIRIFESTVDHLSISMEDMHDFMVHISQRHVDHTPEAKMLLQKYFVASRSARPDCLTKQALIILKQFSESFAKLSMRHDVLPIDVLSAIIICEHSIENIFGTSDCAPPHFGAIPFVGAVDEYLMEFKKWLDAYIEKNYKE